MYKIIVVMSTGDSNGNCNNFSLFQLFICLENYLFLQNNQNSTRAVKPQLEILFQKIDRQTTFGNIIHWRKREARKI